ncbi:hypothetical protein DFH06DRAFT_1343496 [Mycena polygramma]|nr:hypothetical protein DFH06DRAFT_1343496 [Mycena polygramma]
MPPKVKKTIRTLKDTGNAQRFLHRRVGDPNPDHFDKTAYICKYKAEHVYQLSMGKDDETLTSLWTIQCLGHKGRKCSPTVAERPPNWAAISKGHRDALEEFKKVENTATRLAAAAAKVEDALHELDELAGGLPLPLIDERRIGALLNSTQDKLENLEYGILAGFPRPAAGGKRKAKSSNHNGKGKDKGSTKKPSESPSPGSEDADDDGGDVQGPHVSNTPQVTLWPTWMDDPMEDGNAVAKLTAVIYAKAHYAPEIVLMAVPKWTCFEFSDYGAPAGPGFEGFSVVNEKYKDVDAPISLEDRGDLMVFRKRDVFVVDCPGIHKWEEEAVFLRDMEVATKDSLSSSPTRDRAPSASTQSPRSSQPWPPSTRASGSSQPLASSSKRPFNIPDRELRSRKKMRLNNHVDSDD